MSSTRTPTRSMRIPETLEAAARAAQSELAGLGIGELVRAALAMAAGYAPREAAELARGVRGRALSMPESPEMRAARESQPA